MTAPRASTIGLLLTTAILGIACSDLPGAPQKASDADRSLLDGVEGGLVPVLERKVPLTEDEVVSRTIGPSGGAILLPGSGFSVLFPPGSVSEATEITIVAPAGDLVGYHFSPEGLTFDVPLVATQDLAVTESLLGSSPIAAYFEGGLTPTVTAMEILPLSLLGRLGIFEISHFSGYVIATE